ncbi:MAG TPA: hypothetical protein VLQ93_18630, partial [Myxococcaceae bacterium]|nr:hypothetical protein [Myxococcaceae bacterium]
RPSLLAASTLLSLAALGCGPTASELCRERVQLQCERVFECATPEEKALPEFINVYGSTVEACETKFEANNNCADLRERSELCTDINAGETDFDTGRFDECQQALRDLNCEQFEAWFADRSNPAVVPDVCEQVCR